MLKVLSCLVTEHDLRFVLVAAVVCVLGSLIAVRLFANTRNSVSSTRAMWVFMAGFAFGSAVWSTHFLAMLAFEPGLPTGYDPGLTIFSLFVAIAAMIVGFGIASFRTNRFVPAIGGAVIGLGIGAMHYTGMAALRTAGRIEWDFTLVAASVIIGACVAAYAMYYATKSKSHYVIYEVTALLVVAVVGHHFTGMGAITIMPDPFIFVPERIMPTYMMAASVTGVSLLVIATAFATHFVDHSGKSAAEVRIHHLAHFDMLTGLPNRATFLDRIEAERRKAERDNAKFALLSVDLDRFKEVNDIFGHNVGDRVLEEVGNRLIGHVDSDHYIARLGGDEFIAIDSSRHQPADAMASAEKLMTVLSSEMVIDGHNVLIGASIGIAVFPDDGKTAEELMANADLAMYRAKESVGNKICFFERAMDDQVRQRRALGLELREALARNEFELHYQVQKRISTSEVVGYEALLRWHHPTRGNVSPAEFIPIAEDTGLIIPIGTWVLRTACVEAAKWPEPYRVAVNLSPVQFAQSDLAEIVQGILFETGLAASRLELEITESTLIGDMNRTLHILRRLKALGVTIAMDDFGTGYSSLSTLRAFPFDKIKIDRSFVEKVDMNPQAASIVRAILALGQSLSIPVLAEGIETPAHLNFLRAEGCDEVQGYLLGRPRPMKDQMSEMASGKTMNETVLEDLALHDVISAPTPRKAVA
jgi:diguanylate cyclase (GGDEF)-like protein